jgi:hypothetical protein
MAEPANHAEPAEPQDGTWDAVAPRTNAAPAPAWAAKPLRPDELAEPDALRDHEDLLFRLHRLLRPRTYLEIGVNEGHSLRWAVDGTTTVAIDPALVQDDLPPAPYGTAFMALPSDDAFAHPSLPIALEQRPIDLAFVDGLHLVEQVLRDLANVEARAHAGSVLVLDDPLPPEPASAARERETLLWTGDVWKAVVLLRRHRPDLRVVTLDVPPSGATLVVGLDPADRTLAEQHDELLAEVADLDWAADALPQRDELLNVRPGAWTEVLAALGDLVPDPRI